MAVINRVSGLASGIDVDEIIKSLMKTYQMRIDKVKQTKQIWEWRQENYRAINTSLLSFQNTLLELKLQRTYLVKKVSSSDESIVSASVSSSALAATYRVKVYQLATAATNSSAGGISAAAALTGDTLGEVDTTSANRFKISLDGKEMEIQLQETVYYDLNDLVKEISDQINRDDSPLKGKVFVSLTTDNQLRFAAARQADGSVPTIQVTGDAVTILGFSEGQTSQSLDPIDTKASLWSQRDKFLFNNFEWTEDHQFRFTINGEEFVFDGKTASLDSVIAAINKNTNAGVSVFYDPGTDRISLTAVKTGDYRKGEGTEGAEIQIEGGFLSGVLRIDMANEKGGEDAIFEINGLDGMTSHDNSYTVNGVTFTFKKADPEKTIILTVENDIDAVVNSIKNFVDSYNKILEEINKKLTEPRYPDYAPLTEEQIQEGKLTDRQIDAWEEKARSGLLKGDPILSGVLAEMRSALASIVQGVTGEVTVTTGFQQYTTIADRLSVIGITTGDYLERGKLHLDEAKLREALQSNPEAVMELFTRTRDAEGNEITDKSQLGIAVRLYEAVNNAMTRITRQAGSAGSLYDNSYISRMLRQFDERLERMNEQYTRIEDRYYKQFTALEKAIAQMNTQSMWLTMQFASGLQ